MPFMVSPELDEGANHTRTTKLLSAAIECRLLF